MPEQEKNKLIFIESGKVILQERNVTPYNAAVFYSLLLYAKPTLHQNRFRYCISCLSPGTH